MNFYMEVGIRATKHVRLDPKTFIYHTERVTGIDYEKMQSRSRKREIVDARHLAMYFIRMNTRLTTISIGELFNRDHSTVVNACKVVSDHYRFNTQFREKYIALLRSCEL